MELTELFEDDSCGEEGDDSIISYTGESGGDGGGASRAVEKDSENCIGEEGGSRDEL